MTIHEECKPWAHILTAMLADGELGIDRAIRSRSTDELQAMRREIPRYVALAAGLCQEWGLPQAGNIWTVVVLPEIERELARRRRPVRVHSGGGKIARLKEILGPIEDYASRYTRLRPAGRGKFKGLCPLHREKTPSFHIDVARQKWRCFGACATGGDVVDLAGRLENL